jgi:hypothetical protein
MPRSSGASTGFIFPTLDRTDDAFYAPLGKLDTKGARIYLGAIHNMATLKERVAAARKFLPDFGLAAYCGFGRTPPGDMPKCCRITSTR